MQQSNSTKIMQDLITVLNESEIPNPLRYDIYRKMIDSLEQQGWDTQDEWYII